MSRCLGEGQHDRFRSLKILYQETLPADVALPLRPLAGLAQDEKPGSAGGEAREEEEEWGKKKWR